MDYLQIFCEEHKIQKGILDLNTGWVTLYAKWLEKKLSEQSANGNQLETLVRQLPHNWFAVYSGSEKLDLGEKEPLAYVKYESHAKELIKKYGGKGYYERQFA